MSALRTLRFGFSTCPNDTFAFHAAVHGGASAHGIELAPHLADIETLNERAQAGPDRLEVTKLSLPALAQACAHYTVLRSGAAMGFGVGPLLVQRVGGKLAGLADVARARVAVPGLLTTARLLLGVLAPTPREVVPLRFDAIMAAVAAGEVDAGVVIHEGRFTYPQHGLACLADLGALWEERTHAPLPLGVIAARRDLPRATVTSVGALLRASVLAARRDPSASRAFVTQHAQELSPQVCQQHIDLYVNDFSVDFGDKGCRAIQQLLDAGRASGLLPPGPTWFQESR